MVLHTFSLTGHVCMTSLITVLLFLLVFSQLSDQTVNLKFYAKSVEPILIKQEAVNNIPLLVSSV